MNWASNSDVIRVSSPLEGEPNRFKRFGVGYDASHVRYAKNMRKEMTPWELKLWLQLKGKKLGGFKFRRQQPIGPYIVDFVNSEKKLIIELDGSQHIESATDKKRDAYLVAAGYAVMRLWNNEVDADIDAVLAHILQKLEAPHRNAEEAFRLPLKGGVMEP